MKPTETAYINALLADASYRSLTRGMTTEQLTIELRDRLTETQATYLAANFTVVASNQSVNGGFDAVVWQIKAGSALAGPDNENAGRIFLSMRGTQEGQDLLDDVTLVSKGIPYQENRGQIPIFGSTTRWIKADDSLILPDLNGTLHTRSPGNGKTQPCSSSFTCSAPPPAQGTTSSRVAG